MELLARLLMMSMFLYASTVNPFNADAMKGLMKSKNMPFIDILFPLSMVGMFASSIAIVLGVLIPYAAGYLIIFMSIATYYFADFWKAEGQQRTMLINLFTTNITVIGGLLLLILHVSIH